MLIQTESAMHDKNENVIRDCQQPHISKFGNKWYAYGFDRHGLVPAPNHTICYSSTDLKTWTLEDTLFTYPANDVINGNVLYNYKNNEYVFIGQIYGTVATVYTGPTPIGPFTYRNAMTNTAGGVADYTVFADDDGKAYLIYNRYSGTIPQRYAYIYQLNDDYYDIIPSTFCNTNTVMEGFWMVKNGGNYFLLGSGLVGCGVDDNFYITAPTPLGPWTYRGYFVPPGSKTFKALRANEWVV
jgi:beta-xylosidase